MADQTDVSQVIVEPLLGDGGDPGETKVSQEVVEAALSGTSQTKQSQLIVEGLLSATGQAKVSQLVIELLNAPASQTKISQLCIELIRPATTPSVHTPPKVYGTIIG